MRRRPNHPNSPSIPARTIVVQALLTGTEIAGASGLPVPASGTESGLDGASDGISTWASRAPSAEGVMATSKVPRSGRRQRGTRANHRPTSRSRRHSPPLMPNVTDNHIGRCRCFQRLRSWQPSCRRHRWPPKLTLAGVMARAPETPVTSSGRLSRLLGAFDGISTTRYLHQLPRASL